MTFSAQVKQELCKQPLSRRCCAQAEAYGILLYCNTFQPRQVRIITESPQLKQRLPLLFRKAFKVEFDVIPTGEGKGSFLIEDPEKLHILFDTFGLERDSAVSVHINFAHLEEEHCQTAFFRGAFLAGGSVTDPGKSYHLELATSHGAVGRESIALLQELGFTPKDTQRKGNHVTYFKQSDHIEDFLTTVGAPVSAMEIMTAKLERDLRGSVNRRVNCLMRQAPSNREYSVCTCRWTKAMNVSSWVKRFSLSALRQLGQLAQSVIQSGLGHRGNAQLRQLGQGQLRVGHAQVHRLL